MKCHTRTVSEQMFFLGRPRCPASPHLALCMWGPSPDSLPWHWVDTCDCAVIPGKPPAHSPAPPPLLVTGTWIAGCTCGPGSHWSEGGAQQDRGLSFWSTDRVALPSLTYDLQVGTAIVPTGPDCSPSCCRDLWKYPFQVRAKQNKQRGQGAGVCVEGLAGWEAIDASAGIIRARRAPPAGRAPPATGLKINATGPAWSSKTRASGTQRASQDWEEASVSATSACLSLSLSTRTDEVRAPFLPAIDWRLGPSTGWVG